MRVRQTLAWSLIALGILLAIVVVPVGIAAGRGSETRTMSAVKLNEVDYREVRFENDSQGIELGGILLVPEGAGPFSAVAIIHGSGTSMRNNGWYLTLAKHLQERGIVVLLPDKRGSEKSQGDWRTSSFDDLATDTVAAVRFLKSQDMVDNARIGIVGMSQGGHISPLVASKSSDVAFLVNVVGSSTPLRDGLVYEENHNLRQMGFLPGVSNVVAFMSTLYIVNVGQQDFWRAIGDFDPLPYWKRLEIPALVLYGDEDTNVNTAESTARLRSLEKSNIEVIIFEGSGHAIEDPVAQGSSIFREDALERISEFVKSQ